MDAFEWSVKELVYQSYVADGYDSFGALYMTIALLTNDMED